MSDGMDAARIAAMSDEEILALLRQDEEDIGSVFRMIGKNAGKNAINPGVARAVTTRLNKMQGRRRMIANACKCLPREVRASLISRKVVTLPRGSLTLRVKISGGGTTISEAFGAANAGNTQYMKFGHIGVNADGDDCGYDAKLTRREAGFILKDGRLPDGYRLTVQRIEARISAADNGNVAPGDVRKAGDLELRYREGGGTRGMLIAPLHKMPPQSQLVGATGSDTVYGAQYQGEAFDVDGGLVFVDGKDELREFQLWNYASAAEFSEDVEIAFTFSGRLVQPAVAE